MTSAPLLTHQQRIKALLDERAEAALAATSPAAAQPSLPRRPDPLAPAPLTAAQARLWFLSQYETGSCAYNVPVALRLRGALDGPALLDAVRNVADRHHVLRSVHRLEGTEPVARTVTADEVPLRLAHTSPGRLDEDLLREISEPFDLEARPPMRGTLFRLADDDHVLALTFHHIAFDDWSYGLLLEDLAACYAARLGHGAVPPAPVLQHADVAAWERSTGVSAEDLDWWRNRLAGLPGLLELPTDRRRPPVADWTPGRVTVGTGAALADRVRALAARSGSSSFMVLLAAWQALLGRLAGVDDVAVGVPEAGRHHPDTERVVGCFVNTVVARTDLTGDPSGRELLGRVRDVVLDAFAHAGTPFDAVVQAVAPERTLAGAPVVQVLLNVLDDGAVRPGLPGLGGTPVETPPLTAHFDLTLTLQDGPDGFTGGLVFRRDLFGAATVARWGRWFVALLEAMVDDPDRPLSQLDVLDAADLADLIAAGTGPELRPGRSATVVAAILRHADQRPHAPAAADADGSLTFGELADWSAARATAIRSTRAEDAVVGVCVPRDRLLPAALLAVLLGGAAYLPLEPGDPAEHHAAVCRAAGVRTVVSRGAALARAITIAGVRVLDLDTVPTSGAALDPPSPDDLAYVLYTSGSTGEPKGVEISHASLAAVSAALADWPGITSGDTFLGLAPLTFDASAVELWAALAAGARCHVVPRDVAVDGHLLAQSIATAGITTMIAPPTTLRMLLAAGCAFDRRLRVWSGGEALDRSLAEEVLPKVGELWNAYGPTEATVISAVHRVDGAVAGETAPIGGALAGEVLYVVDSHSRLAPPGVTGELWIGGVGVARGYRGRPDLTQAAFVPNPFGGGRCYRTGDLVRWTDEGVLEFVGRRDSQVKVRGYRIELGAVEAAVLHRPGVGGAVVTVAGRGAGAHLVGYVAPASRGMAVDPVALQADLARTSPAHLVPRRWIFLEAFPRLPSGKIDRSALPAPDDGPPPPEGRQPSSEAELLVAEVWGAVLDRDGIGAGDDFFGLGGHSLAATQVAGRLSDALGCHLPVRTLFDRPVLADLAAEIERLVLADLAAAEVAS